MFMLRIARAPRRENKRGARPASAPSSDRWNRDYLPAGGLESELIGEEDMSEEVMLPVSVEAEMPLSVVALVVEVSVLVEVEVVVSVVVAGVSSTSVSSFLQPAKGTRRRASRQSSERLTDSF